jgi:hypothetical protein
MPVSRFARLQRRWATLRLLWSNLAATVDDKLLDILPAVLQVRRFDVAPSPISSEGAAARVSRLLGYPPAWSRFYSLGTLLKRWMLSRLWLGVPYSWWCSPWPEFQTHPAHIQPLRRLRAILLLRAPAPVLIRAVARSLRSVTFPSIPVWEVPKGFFRDPRHLLAALRVVLLARRPGNSAFIFASARNLLALHHL